MMNLYSGTTCPFSHRCRIVLYEKGMDFQVIDVDLFSKADEIAVINPHGRVPVLAERGNCSSAWNGRSSRTWKSLRRTAWVLTRRGRKSRRV